jgi:uncharacterized membrane protein
MTADRDLRACALAAVACAAVALAAHLTAVRAVAAVPLCLVLPGYALTAAFFARTRLELRSIVMLTLALSLTTLILGSLLLNFTPWGLRAGTWAALLLAVVLGGCTVAGLRREPRAKAPGTAARVRLPRPRVRARDVALLTLAAMIAAGAMVVSRIPLSAPNAVGYTAMWMLPGHSGSGSDLEIGIQSAEQQPTSYRLVVEMGARSTESSFVLTPGGRTEVPVPLDPRPVAGTVVAMLYRNTETGVYRRVTARL